MLNPMRIGLFLFLLILTAAPVAAAPVAILVVGQPATHALEEDLIHRLQGARRDAHLTPTDLPILTYHFDKPDQRRYCEGRLGIRKRSLLFVGLARLAADRLPSEVVEGNERVTDAAAAANHVFVLALAQTGRRPATDHAVGAEERYAQASAAGDAAMQHRDYEAALRAYDAALGLRPLLWRSHVRRAGALIALARPREAEQAALRAIALAPEESAPHGVLALALDAAAQRDVAPAEYAIAIRLAPQWAVPHAWLAQHALGGRDFDLAAREATLSNTLDPRQAAPAYVLGTVAIQGWKLAEARRWLEAAVQRQPDWDRAWDLLGWERILAGDYAGAEAAYDKIVEEAPRWVGLALARYYAGDATGALAAVRKVPENSLARAVEGFALAAQGDGSGALAAARAALALDPRNPNGYEALADAETVLGGVDAALGDYERAEALLRGWPEPQLLLKWARACRQAGKPAAAEALLRRLAGAYRGNPFATEAEKLLK